MDRYQTLLNEGTALLSERKSRFLGFALPLADPDAADAYIAFLRKTYPDANHVVYAYRFALPEQYSRFSDDGEPKGTAGPPLFDALCGAALFQCGVFVVRYFGGTRLGTGGLVRAYGRTAADAIGAAGVVTKTKVSNRLVTIGYECSERAQDGLQRAGFQVHDPIYTEHVQFTVPVPSDSAERFAALINDLSSGRAQIADGGDGYLTSVKDDTIQADT